MTTGRDSGDARNGAAERRFGRPTRRRVLASLGGATAAALAGCTGSGDSASPYVDGEMNDSAVDAANNTTRSAAEMSAASSVAQVEATQSASVLDSLELADHEFTVTDGYKKGVVQGTVRNTSDQMLELAEVRVRVFDDSGTYLGRYLDSVGDFGANTTWEFEVVVLASAESVASYDIAVFGIPE